MKKITIKVINEDIYYEKLDNGIDVYLYVNPNIHSNYVTFTTKYGSVYNEFTDNSGKMKKFPNGIAHFLEHKVFVQKDGPQPEDFYAQRGGICNAYTTFKNTTYLFSCTDKLEENIVYLLDFVQNIYLTDENVQSEKGIITQEINMCNDTPSDVLYDKIRENAIKNNSFKESIIGTVDEVNSITKELLTECYQQFYNPNNMFLVVTGNFDVDKILSVIEENQNKKEFPNLKKVETKKYNEPDEVVKEKEIIKFNTNIPKIAYSVKIPIKDFGIDKREFSIYMFILFSLLFGDTSSFDEEVKKEGIITNSLSYNILDIDSHFIISLTNSTENYEKLIEKIDERLQKINIDSSEFERKKRVLISNEVFSYENIEMVNDMIVDNIICDNKIDTDIIETIRAMRLEKMHEIVKKTSFLNKSIVILKN